MKLRHVTEMTARLSVHRVGKEAIVENGEEDWVMVRWTA
jgi:hypothetical protein